MGLVKPSNTSTLSGLAVAGVTRPSPPAGPISLPGSGFVTLQTVKKQAVVVVYGGGGLGKTTVATELVPAPVALINLDGGRADYAVKKAQEELGRVIHYSKIMRPPGLSRMTDDKASAAARQIVKDQVMRDIDVALSYSAKGAVRTICIDTGTELDELVKIWYRGNKTGAVRDYGDTKGKINQFWWSIFDDCRTSGAHLLILARGRAVWADDAPTGEYEPKVNDNILDAIDWAVHVRRRRRAGVVQVAGGVTSGIVPATGGIVRKSAEVSKENEWKVTKAGNNGPELGAVYTQDQWGDDGEYGNVGPFVYACCRMYPGTEPADWS